MRINLGPLLRVVKRRRRALLALLVLLIFLGGSGLFRTQAQVATLYPTTCLGGWENPQHAEGEPDSQDGYTRENSAVLSDAQAQIFCSGFSGNLPEEMVHTSVTLHMVWGERTVAPIAEAPSEQATTTIVADESLASTTDEILNLPDDVPAEIVVPLEPVDEPAAESTETQDVVPEEVTPVEPEPTPEPEPVSEPVPEPEPAPEPEPEPEPAPSEPTVFDFFVTRVHAQELTEAAPVPEESQVEEPVEELEIEPQVEATVETPVSESTIEEPVPEATTEDVAVPVEENSDMLEVLYTLDGIHWYTLAKVDDLYADRVFEIPATAFATAADISKLQIAVHTLPTTLDRDPVYLDALWLEVAYQELEEPEPPLPILKERVYTKEIVIDPEALHACQAAPFSVDVSKRSTASVKLMLSGTWEGAYELEVGGLPLGIDMFFVRSDDYVYHPSVDEDTATLRVSAQEGAREGNFTVPVIFTKQEGKGSSVICQVNIVNL